MFIFNDISTEDMNIVIEQVPSETPFLQVVDESNTNNKNGAYTFYTKEYTSINKTYYGHYLGDNIEAILEWLDTEVEGKLITENFKDRYYKARLNDIKFDKVQENLYKISLSFRVKPFGYILDNSKIELKNNSTLLNKYSHFSEPLIFITGRGNINITINDKELAIKDLESNIIIDTELEEAYYNNEKLTYKTTGDFPTLERGINNISYTGAVNKIEILPNWRCKL